MQSRHVRGEVFAILALLVLAGAVRQARLAVAWDYWAIDYIANVFVLRDDLAAGGLPWTRLVGMHPPQHGLATAGLLAAGGSVRALFLLSLGLSLGAIGAGAWWIWRVAGPAGALGFAAVAAVAPHGVHYGLELNNYPAYVASMAATTVAFALAWQTPERGGRAIALGVCSTAALHAHFFAVPLLAALLVAAAWSRRWRLAAALTTAFVLAAPVLLSLAGAGGGRTQPLHNDRLAPAELGRALWQAWDGRFGSAVTFGSLAVATLVAAIIALRDPRVRAAATLATGLGLGGAAVVLAGHAIAATDVGQTPYWVHVAWCQLAVFGLGFGVASRRSRVMLAVLAAPWLLSAGARAAAPAGWSTPPDDAGDPVALSEHLDLRWEPGDVLVYLWDTPYPNDDPLHRDPLMAALPPRAIGDFLPRTSPFPGYGHRFADGEAYFLPSTGLRDDEHGRGLHAAVAGWRADGRRVHVVFAAADPSRSPGDLGVSSNLAAAGAEGHSESSAGAARVVVVEPTPP